MNESLIREWVRQMLVEKQIVTFAAREEEKDEDENVTQTSAPEKRFALSSDQADKITDYLSTVDPATDKARAETHDPEAFKNEIIKALGGPKSNKAVLFKELMDEYEVLAGKSGGILDTLKLIAMGSTVEAVAAAMFSGSPPTGIKDADAPIEVVTPTLLAPLFHVEEKGRGKTMGRGEVLLTLSYLETVGAAGKQYDVEISGQKFHVKDLTEGNDIALGKTGAWDRGVFPFKQFSEGGANLGELSEEGMMKSMGKVFAAYKDGTASGSPWTVNTPADLEKVATHLQDTLDKVVTTAKGSFGDADGIIFAKGQKLYACGPKALHFSRTSQSALRVAPKLPLGKAPTEMSPYKAVIASTAYIKKLSDRKGLVSRAHGDVQRAYVEWVENTKKGIDPSLNTGRKIFDALKKVFGRANHEGSLKNPKSEYTPGWRWYVFKVMKDDTQATVATGTKSWGKPDWIPDEDDYWIEFLENVKVFSISENLLRKYVRGMITEASDVKFTIKNEKVVRSLVQEAMITEELTKSDEDRIGVIIRKEIDTAWKKDLEKKVETLMAKQFKDAYNNDNFYKAVARVYKELMRVYAEEQWKFSRKFTRYDVPVARFRP